MQRTDDRSPGDLRPWSFELGYLPYAEGSVMVTAGSTKVLCAVSVEERQPPWMKEPGRGWVKAEYGMLPRATHQRNRRESNRSSGRTHEIQRLIGRSLRGVFQLEQLGPRTLVVDCDVIVADAGTRTAAVTGGWLAAVLACARAQAEGLIPSIPVADQVAAVSLGIVDGLVYTDLDYSEDSAADTDLNLVMTGSGGIIEIQGTAERAPFSRRELDAILDAGEKALGQIFEAQRRALASAGIEWKATAR